MTEYGTARAMPRRSGCDEIAEILTETPEEERETDEKLTELAESVVNAEAEAAGGDKE